MKQKVYIHALIKKADSLLLLRRAQGRPEIMGKHEIPGGRLPFDQEPEYAIVDLLSQQIGREVSNVRLVNVLSFIPRFDHQLQIVSIMFRASISETEEVAVSSPYDKFAWIPMQEIQQYELTEVTKHLLGKVLESKVFAATTSLPQENIVINTSDSTAIIYCDGGSRGNPGPSASGFVILDKDEQLIEEGGAYLGITTNNQAEYHAVRLALEAALKRGVQTAHLKLDSLLVVNQMNGIFKIRNRDLWPIHERIKQLVQQFKEIKFTHVRREYNKEADAMVNKILDEHIANLKDA